MTARAASGTLLALVLLFCPDAGAGQASCPGAAAGPTASGWEAYGRGDVEAARKSFEEAVSRCPGHTGARTGLGYVHLREGGDREARIRFREVLEDDPESVDARVGLGLLAWRRGDLEAVERRFQEVLERAPDDPTALEYLERVEEARTAEGGEDEASRAWEAGERDRAERLYAARVSADSTDVPALHRLALLRAWRGDYRGGLDLLERLVRIAPDHVGARIDRARILGWSGAVGEGLEQLERVLDDHPRNLRALEARADLLSWAGEARASRDAYRTLASAAPDVSAGALRARALGGAGEHDEAVSAYDSLLAREPGDVDHRLGLGRVLVLASRHDSAISVFRGVLEDEPGSVEAQMGLARARSWAGRLLDGEEAWRRAVRMDPGGVDALLGLAQVLRWQGRIPAALEVLERARESHPGYPAIEEQLRWVRAALSPRVRPTFARERDSDGNAMATSAVTAAWHPIPRLGVRVDAHRRDADQSPLDLARISQGVTVSGSYLAEPGWRFSAALGGTESDGAGDDRLASVRLGVETPGRYPVVGSAAYDRSPVDATALQVERGVVRERWEGGLRWRPDVAWRVLGTVAWSEYAGTRSNAAWEVSAGLTRELADAWRLQGGLRTFGYERDVNDGYFDPDRYGLAELAVIWLREWNRLSFRLEAAPGLQEIGSDGETTGAFRGRGRVAVGAGPGREVYLDAGYSTNGLQSFSTGTAGYWYRSLVVGGSWVLH